MIVVGAVLAACADSAHQAGVGALSGQVVVSGPLRKAAVSVDQVDPSVKSSVAVLAHVGDATTDEDGRFEIQDAGTFNGLLLITAKGGSFTDLASGATVVLDPGVGLETLTDLKLLEQRDDVLVSPAGHLIAARTRALMGTAGDVDKAQSEAESHLDRHLAGVTWSRVQLGSLATTLTSPTEPVRAALVQAALSYLARDIAEAAHATPQEVNVFTLTQQLAVDISQGPFDGNDNNSLVFGEGLQLGSCAPTTTCNAPPGDACGQSSCRPKCDLYAGTLRALLAGEMTKVIRDPGLNKTGLVAGDILAVARSMSDNVDQDLFGSACIETLDRLPPTLSWSAKPGEGDFVRGTVMLTATAVDDIDVPPSPTVHIAPYGDVDGDQRNNVATAMIDTTTAADGPITITAQAVDTAGNATTITRTLQVDNTLPVVTLEDTSFVVVTNTDDNSETLWTADPHPSLTGSVTEAHPASVEAVIGATHVVGTVSGSTWTVDLAEGTIGLAGGEVHIVLTDVAGNQGTMLKRIRFDNLAPVMSIQASPVHNEASETPTFSTTPGSPSTDEIPSHIHGGAVVDLSASGTCPSITKYSYLLGANPPPIGAEPNGRNPLAYQLLVSDDGVGIVPDATLYRVGREAAGGTTQWITTFTSVGTGGSLGAGVTGYTVPIYSTAVTGLDSIEGVYHVEFQSKDRFGRTATAARCFNLRLRAPPLRFGTMTVNGKTYAAGDAQGHMYAMLSLGLGATPPFNQIAARVLNTGAASSLLDMPVTNGTASTVYLTVRVTRPAGATASQTFSQRFVWTVNTVNTNCEANPGDSDCHSPPSRPASFDGRDSPAVSGLVYPVRVYQLDANGTPVTAIPCLDHCLDTSDVFRFALPPRPLGAAPLRFLVMSMVGQITALFPQGPGASATPPFSDFTIGGVALSGVSGPSASGCTHFVLKPPVNGKEFCVEVTEYFQYRALMSASFTLSTPLLNTYAVATGLTTTAEDPLGHTHQTSNFFEWSTTETGPLPF